MSSVVPQDPFNEYIGNGVATVYPYEFQLLAAADLVVTINDVVIPTSEFSVSGIGTQSGGSVTFTTAPVNLSEVLLSRVIALQRDIDYQYNGDFRESTVDLDFNRIWQAIQGVFAWLGGAVRAPFPEQVPALPNATARANTILAFDANGDPTVMVPVSGSATDVLLQFAGTTDITKGDALVGVKRTAANAVATTLHAWIEGTVLDAARDFEVVADGVTDQRTKLATAIATATSMVPCTLELPRGVIYCATSLGNLAVNGLTIKGKGLLETTLKFGHAGIAMLADAFASGSPSDPFVRANFLDFTIQGNAATTHIFQAQGLARSEINLNAKEAEPTAGIAFHLKGLMLSDIRIRCSTDIQAMTSVPYEGMRLEAGTRAGASVGNSSNNVITSPRFVGLSIGERFSGADQNTIIGGAAESNSVYGLLIAGGCRYNTFIGHGLENPSASSADFAEAGESTRFINGYSSNKVLLQGYGCKIEGGFFERIEVQAGAIKNDIEGVRLNNWRTGSGGFFDNGTATCVQRLRGTTLTATFATSVMTVTAATQGVLAVGQEVVASGVTTGTTISSLGTGTGGTGTYNLSTSPGTLSSRAVSTLADVEFLADRAGITVGASPYIWTNNTGRYVDVAIQTGTVTQIRGMRGSDTWLRPIAIPGVHLVAPGDRLEVSYSVLPGMSYIPHNSFQG